MADLKPDLASERFNEVAAQWDQKPSTVACTNKMAEAIKEMNWYSMAKSGKSSMRAMDFGCGTGLLASKIFDSDIFSEIVGVDVAEGMIEVFQEKIRRKNFEGINAAAICMDLRLLQSIRFEILGTKSPSTMWDLFHNYL